MKRAFQQVDVFTATPYWGNPLAVVLDGGGLSDAQMQRFAAWTNLSETTFVMPPTPEAAAAGADYQVRIFTTHYEMPFAGHPTLGSCHAWLAAGGIAKDPACVVQQCQVGLVPVRRNGSRLAFAAPPLQRRAPSDALWQALPQALGIAPDQLRAAQHLHNGPDHFGVWLDHPDTVHALSPDLGPLQSLMEQGGFSGIGVAAAYDSAAAAPLIARSNREARAFASTSGTASAPAARTRTVDAPDLEVRFFFTRGDAVAEDPATGSFNASLAQWLMADGLVRAHYVAAQGTQIDRNCRLYLSSDLDGKIWVGGDAITCVEGSVEL